MSFFNRLTAVIVVAALFGVMMPLEASTRKGNTYLADGRAHEAKKEWDEALADYEKALLEDPADLLYQMAVEKARFQDGQLHIDMGLKLREQGKLGDALLEFQKAYSLNPGSTAAVQELQLTEQMIERERKRVETTGHEAPAEVRAMTPVEAYEKQQDEKLNRLLSVPELRPLNPAPINLKMNNKTKVLFETVGKIAGINVLWDPEYTPPPRDGFNIDLEDSTIEQALDYLAVLTKSYWKALSPNTIFITMDNPNKRRDYEEQVSQIFYLQNVTTTQELQEIVNAIRTIADINKVYPYNSQFAVIVRGEADRVELAEKIVHDLDRPKAEVVVDIMVLEANSVFSRKLTSAIAATGLNVPFTFNPRNSVTLPTSGTSDTSSGSTTTNSGYLPANRIGDVGLADYATTLPSALLQAVMSDARTKVLQAPQLRSVDNVKATLKIGEKEPTASGSFTPGTTGIGVSSLVNTQFTYLDVGVNVELTPRVMEDNDVYMHIDLDISNVAGSVNLGGIDQPIIGQRKVTHDIRLKAGEVGLLGGLINQQDNKTVTGIPGLSSIPLLGRLFSGQSVDHNRDELMIVLIPHIIRRPEVTVEALRAIQVGNTMTVKLSHAPNRQAAPSTAPAGTAPAAGAAAVPAMPGMPPATSAPVNAPPTVMPPATAPPAMAPPATAPPENGGSAAAPAPEAPKPPEGPPKVYFAPTAVNSAVGQNFTVTLSLDNGLDVAAAPMIVQFDPKKLRLTDITQGNLFTTGGKEPIFAKNIQNDAGRASIELNVPRSSSGVTAEKGTLVTLHFQAVAPGSSNISIPFLTVRNSRGDVITSSSPQLAVNIK
jgi:general secretion pathway protein D